MLFSVNTEVIVDCFPSGFSDKKDQWTNLYKAILVPFLKSTENSFKAMQKNGAVSHFPYFIVGDGVINRGEIQNFISVP